MRLLMVQYADDYRQAFQRFEGGNETYYAQKYSIDTVAKIRKKLRKPHFFCKSQSNGVMRSFAGCMIHLKISSGCSIIDFLRDATSAPESILDFCFYSLLLRFRQCFGR